MWSDLPRALERGNRAAHIAVLHAAHADHDQRIDFFVLQRVAFGCRFEFANRVVDQAHFFVRDAEIVVGREVVFGDGGGDAFFEFGKNVFSAVDCSSSSFAFELGRFFGGVVEVVCEPRRPNRNCPKSPSASSEISCFGDTATLRRRARRHRRGFGLPAGFALLERVFRLDGLRCSTAGFVVFACDRRHRGFHLRGGFGRVASNSAFPPATTAGVSTSFSFCQACSRRLSPRPPVWISICRLVLYPASQSLAWVLTQPASLPASRPQRARPVLAGQRFQVARAHARCAALCRARSCSHRSRRQ